MNHWAEAAPQLQPIDAVEAAQANVHGDERARAVVKAQNALKMDQIWDNLSILFVQYNTCRVPICPSRKLPYFSRNRPHLASK